MRSKFGGALALSGVIASSLLVGIQPAHAAGGTVSASGAIVTVTGSDAAEKITIYSSDSATYIEVNTFPDFTPGAGCTIDPTTTWISCDLASPGRVNVDAGGGDDEITADSDASFNTQIVTSAGPGNDEMWGGPAIEGWFGEDGNDVVNTDLASNEDEVGPDLVRGGAGTDEVRFATFLTKVSVTLDDQLNDTSSANPDYDINDIGSDVEVVWGTGGDDSLTGNDLPQRLEGSAGNDAILGLGGDDTANGGRGNDSIDGGAGNDAINGSDNDDTLQGGAGNDTIFGGPENDNITGGPGLDTINGDSGDLFLTGNDTINAVDGEKDSIACGPGGDTANVDDIDVVSTQAQDVCESLSVTATQGPPPPPGPVAGASTATPTGKVLRTNKRRTAIKLPLTCAGGTSECSGKVTVKAKRATLAKGRYSIAASTSAKVTVKLTRQGRAALKRKASVKVVVNLVSADGSTTKRTYTLKRR